MVATQVICTLFQDRGVKQGAEAAGEWLCCPLVVTDRIAWAPSPGRASISSR